jgi:hypothetical protein
MASTVWVVWNDEKNWLTVVATEKEAKKLSMGYGDHRVRTKETLPLTIEYEADVSMSAGTVPQTK